MVWNYFFCAFCRKYIAKRRWLDKIYFDKIVHAALYFILFYLIIYGIKLTIPSNQKQLVIATILCVIQGVLIEFIQGSSFIQFRSFDVFDIVANCVGVGIGITFSQKI
ncbi:MAG: VanZ family protein [Saprospirales bacterium]|nr:VanZ family protein [Saprospirales bacterium]